MAGNSEAIVGRHSRAIRIMTCLQAGPAFNARELATRLKVSRRTIYRDLNLIRDAGIRVQFDSESSGYRVSNNSPHALVPPRFGERDLAKLAITSHFSLLHGFPDFSVAVRESVARLLSHYPHQTRESVARLLNCCSVELPRPQYAAGTVDAVETLLSAITRQRQVRIEFHDEFAAREACPVTRLAPFRLIAAMDDWWVVGRSTFHRRIVRLPTQAIRTVELTEIEYRVPHTFRTRLERSRQTTAKSA